MAVATIPFNPYVTTVARGMFNVESRGLRQGTAYQSPNARYNLRGGVLDDTETLPMWGGVGVYMNVPGVAGDPSVPLGVIMGRATALTGSKALAGFSVFDQNYSAVNSPQSEVPVVAPPGQVNAYPLGSGARIAVACDPVLASLIGGPIGANVSWDFVNQLLVPFNAAALTITSGTYDDGTGVVALVMSAPINFGPGDAVVVSGLTGTGAFASLNGTFTSIAPTSGTTVTYNAGAGLGASTITGGSLSLGSGANSILPCKVLDVQTTNCITVVRDPITGFVTWDYDDCCAVIQI